MHDIDHPSFLLKYMIWAHLKSPLLGIGRRFGRQAITHIISTMQLLRTLGLVYLPLFMTSITTRAQNIVLTNDDGWATAQIWLQFNALQAADYNMSVVFLSLFNHYYA